ncbi:RNA ligase [Rhizobium phaseoli]|uniref:RNA ligase n=1 Tax=Rhizobium phaseoli TaxID=396 RepID=UPI00255406B6|nr:RNA ligase [Rhizobium phaseoli]MDK4727446.1 RNA ligase [Rhizobium phaseoli]
MIHPSISHINDVLPHIDGRTDFIVAHKAGYSVIDYVYALADSFDDPVRIECRGLKFSADGSILARPLHKFFNINERPGTQAHLLDFSRPHTVMEKLDGSMIHPAVIDGEVVFMTRMGRTDVAMKAERHLTPELRTICAGLLMGGATPIFEFTAPDNRIVVRYEESALTLLAVRNTVDGVYWPRSTLEGTGLPIVPAHNGASNGADFTAYARAVLGMEGFVVRFDDGLWVKAKGDDYVLKHKAKDSILQEKNILQLVLSGGLDDVLPLLDEADSDAAKAYRDAVEAGIARTINDLARFVAANENVPQKEFAIDRVRRLPKLMQPLAFTIRKGVDAGEAVRASIIANASSQARVDEFRELHGATWAA